MKHLATFLAAEILAALLWHSVKNTLFKRDSRRIAIFGVPVEYKRFSNRLDGDLTSLLAMWHLFLLHQQCSLPCAVALWYNVFS